MNKIVFFTVMAALFAQAMADHEKNMWRKMKMDKLLKKLKDSIFDEQLGEMGVLSLRIPYKPDDARDFLQQLGHSFGVDWSRVGEYGCWCSRITSDGTEALEPDNHPGNPIDTLDNLCKQYLTRRHCLKIRGGSCGPGTDWAGLYYPSQFYDVDNINTFCGNTNDGCAKDVCMTDFDMLLALIDLANVDEGSEREHMGYPSWYGFNSNSCYGDDGNNGGNYGPGYPRPGYGMGGYTDPDPNGPWCDLYGDEGELRAPYQKIKKECCF